MRRILGCGSSCSLRRPRRAPPLTRAPRNRPRSGGRAAGSLGSGAGSDVRRGAALTGAGTWCSPKRRRPCRQRSLSRRRTQRAPGLSLATRVVERGHPCSGFQFANRSGRTIGTIDRSEDRQSFGFPLTMILATGWIIAGACRDRVLASGCSSRWTPMRASLPRWPRALVTSR
jgi:hypothetical protein